jgi:hypothetical protein
VVQQQQSTLGVLSQSNGRLATTTRAVAPNVKEMKKNNRKPGGQLLAPGVWFYATYENSSLLGKVFSTLADIVENFMLVFTDRGLRIMTVDDGDILTTRLEVPRASFLCYVDLCESALSFVIAGKKIKRFGKICTAKQTLTFCRNQNGNNAEPLELMLCPLDGSFESGAVTRASFKSNEDEQSHMMPVSPHQYQITMPASFYAEKIRDLVLEASDICLEISESTLKMSAIDADGGGDLYTGVPAKRSLQEALQNDCCYLERLPGADPAVQLNSLPPYRFLAAYLETITRFGSGVAKVVLRFGLRDSPTQPGVKEESLLYISYTFGEDGAAPFTLQTWLAPRVELD